VLLPAEGRARPAPAAPRRLVPASPPTIPSARAPITRHQRGFKQFTRPVFPSPARTGWNGPPLRLPPGASAPRRPGADDARQGRGQALEHGPGTTRSTSHPLILQSVVHSSRATSRRTVRPGRDRRARAGACAVYESSRDRGAEHDHRGLKGKLELVDRLLVARVPVLDLSSASSRSCWSSDRNASS
jgi:hypothetical protein